MAGQTLHDVRADAFNYVWDNSIAPEVEVESGDDVELHVRDAGRRADHAGVRRRRGRGARLLAREPRLGAGVREGRPARRHPGRRDPRAAPARLGLDGDHPRLRPPRRRVPRSVASDLEGRGGRAPGRVRRGHRAAVRAVPRHDRGRAARARRALRRPAVGLGREHGREAPARRDDALPAGRRRGRALLGGRHARRDGRRRGVRHGGRGAHGHRRSAGGAARHDDLGAAVPRRRRATWPAPRPDRTM